MFKVKSNLARQLKDRTGSLVRDLERQASEQLETRRDDIMASVAETLRTLETLCAAAPDDAGPQVYALASSIVDIAGYYDTGPLFDAAYSLCKVSDRMIQTGTWHWPSIQVHAQALSLILAGGCRLDRTSETLLAGLSAISRGR